MKKRYVAIVIVILIIFSLISIYFNFEKKKELNNNNVELILNIDENTMIYNETTIQVQLRLKNTIDNSLEIDDIVYRGFNITSLDNESRFYDMISSGTFTCTLQPKKSINLRSDIISSSWLELYNEEIYKDNSSIIGKYSIQGYFITEDRTIEIYSNIEHFEIIE